MSSKLHEHGDAPDKVVRVRGSLYARLNELRVQRYRCGGDIPSITDVVADALDAFLRKEGL